MPTRRSTPSSPLSRSCSTTSDSTTCALPARALPAPTRRSRKTGCCGARAGNVAAEHMFARDSGGGRMRVLGVDPGLTRCCLGVGEGGPGVTLRLVGTTVITTPAATDIGGRLLMLEQQIEVWLRQHRPDAVAVERGFSRHNGKTVKGP